MSWTPHHSAGRIVFTWNTFDCPFFVDFFLCANNSSIISCRRRQTKRLRIKITRSCVLCLSYCLLFNMLRVVFICLCLSFSLENSILNMKLTFDRSNNELTEICEPLTCVLDSTICEERTESSSASSSNGNYCIYWSQWNYSKMICGRYETEKCLLIHAKDRKCITRSTYLAPMNDDFCADAL